MDAHKFAVAAALPCSRKAILLPEEAKYVGGHKVVQLEIAQPYRPLI